MTAVPGPNEESEFEHGRISMQELLDRHTVIYANPSSLA